MDLHRYQTFERLYHHQSLIKAAKDLSVTSSAVSQSIQNLEESLGVQLFLRIGKKVVPTQEAQKLIEAVAPLFQRFQEVTGSFKSGKTELEGALRVGTVPEFGLRETLKAVKEFQKLHPKVEFTVLFRSTSSLLSLLMEHEIDLALMDSGLHEERLASKIVFQKCIDEELVMACSRVFFEEEVPQKRLLLKDYSKLKHIGYQPGEDGVTKWYRYHFGRLPSYPVSLYAENARGVFRGIELGFGVGVLPKFMIEKELNKGSFVLLDPKGAVLTSRILLAQLGSRVPGILEKEFCRYFLRRLS